jgi:hypothetical protein
MGGVSAAAYGVRLAGAPPTRWLALAGAADWPEVRLERADGVDRPRIDADRRVATVDSELGVGELVHPALAGIGLTMAVARGLDALHAGAVAGPEGAWAVAGPKEAGKSTLLAACATARIEVVADDVLVVSGEHCFAGPRCVDVRPEADGRFGPATPVRPETPRLRLTLPAGRAEHRLSGLIHLAWGTKPALRPLSPTESLERLLALRAVDGFPRDPIGLLELSGRPAYELKRSHDWDTLPGAVRAVRGLLRLPAGSSLAA